MKLRLHDIQLSKYILIVSQYHFYTGLGYSESKQLNSLGFNVTLMIHCHTDLCHTYA